MSAFLEDRQILELMAAARVPKHLQQGGSGGLGKGPGGGKKKRKGKGKNGGGPNMSRMPGISPMKKAPQKLPVLPPSGHPILASVTTPAVPFWSANGPT